METKIANKTIFLSYYLPLDMTDTHKQSARPSLTKSSPLSAVTPRP